MRHRSLLFAAVASAAALLALAPPAAAVWPINPAVNLPVCTAATDQIDPPQSVTDGAGGAFVVWSDPRAGVNHDIYAQHVMGAGYMDPAWPANGRAIITLSSDQILPQIVTDGAGGAIVVWADFRAGGSVYAWYARRVLANGTFDPAWGTDGRLLFTQTSYAYSLKTAPDGAGGVLVCWYENRGVGTGSDIYAQRVLSGGTLAWGAGGVRLTSAAGEQVHPEICPDGLGGALVAWTDWSKIATDDYDVYVHRVGLNGTVDSRWPMNGLPVCTLAGRQESIGLCPNGAGGAYLAWADGRSGTDRELYALHVLENGTFDPLWPATGRRVHGSCNLGPFQVPALLPGPSGGVVVVDADSMVVANRVFTNGTVDPAWPVGGVQLSLYASTLPPAVAPDGAGGAIVVNNEDRGGPGLIDLYAYRVRANGALDPAWPAGGRAVCTAPQSQAYMTAVSDGSGGVIAAWVDGRNAPATGWDVYAQRVRSTGVLGVPEPLIASAQDVRGDQGGRLLLMWSASEGDAAPNPYVGAYHVWRRINADVGAARATPATAREPGEGPRAGDVREQPGVAGSTWWEFIATVPASRLANYALLVSTTADSLPGWIPWNVFVVDAEDNAAWGFYSSPTDSGYSADNLAPGLTAPAFGQYTQGMTLLHWVPNPAPDLLEYRLYRSEHLEFTPGPSNFVAAVKDTYYLDAPGRPYYYILNAVDVHGNAGTNGLILPDGALDAGGPSPPRSLAFRGAQPNPARGTATFAFDLPAAANVRVAIFDVAGRCVQELRAELPAGSHRLAWDARDAAGGSAAPGLYLARFEALGATKHSRFVLTR